MGKDFINRAPAAQKLRERVDKWDFMKQKSFCTAKEVVSKLKRAPTKWGASYTPEKGLICASYTPEKGLITKIYRELKKLNSPITSEPIKKWATELNITFSKEEIQMAKKNMKNAHHLWP
jgi:hypothetical protein